MGPLDADVAWLNKGWDWMMRHPDDPRLPELERKWFARLAKYESAYRSVMNAQEVGLL